MNNEERIIRLEKHVDVLNRLVYQLALEINANNPSLEFDDYGEISGIDSDWDKSHTFALVEKSRSLPFFDPETGGGLIITDS
jgi:hypothetical protein